MNVLVRKEKFKKKISIQLNESNHHTSGIMLLFFWKKIYKLPNIHFPDIKLLIQTILNLIPDIHTHTRTHREPSAIVKQSND